MYSILCFLQLKNLVKCNFPKKFLSLLKQKNIFHTYVSYEMMFYDIKMIFNNRIEADMKNLLLFIIFFSAVTFAAAQPKIVFEGGDKMDWGDISAKDTTYETQIKIVNKGNELLRIWKVKAACSCTSAPLKKKELKPGESTVVDVTFHSNGYPGEKHKVIDFTSNDPVDRVKTFHLYANVVPSISFFPKKSLQFGLMNKNQENTAIVVLTNNTKNDIVIKEIDAKIPGLKLNIKENAVIKPKADLDIKATVTPDAEGPFSYNLTLKTTDPEMYRIIIPLRGTVK